MKNKLILAVILAAIPLAGGAFALWRGWWRKV